VMGSGPPVPSVSFRWNISVWGGDPRLNDGDDEGYIINGVYVGVVLILHLLADAADRLASCVCMVVKRACLYVCVLFSRSVPVRAPYKICVRVIVYVCRVKTANRAAHKSVPSLPYASRSREMFRLMWRRYDTYARQWRQLFFFPLNSFFVYFGNLVLIGVRLDRPDFCLLKLPRPLSLRLC